MVRERRSLKKRTLKGSLRKIEIELRSSLTRSLRVNSRRSTRRLLKRPNSSLSCKYQECILWRNRARRRKGNSFLSRTFPKHKSQPRDKRSQSPPLTGKTDWSHGDKCRHLREPLSPSLTARRRSSTQQLCPSSPVCKLPLTPNASRSKWRACSWTEPRELRVWRCSVSYSVSSCLSLTVTTCYRGSALLWEAIRTRCLTTWMISRVADSTWKT